MSRFSRSFVQDRIQERINSLQDEYGFQPGWGWARVENRPVEVIVAFGRYSELLDMQEEFEPA